MDLCGKAKMCWVSYRKAWNNKTWPLPLAWRPRLALLLLQPRVLSLTPLLGVWSRAAHVAEWQQIQSQPKPCKCLWENLQTNSQERSVQLPCIAVCVKTQEQFPAGVALIPSLSSRWSGLQIDFCGNCSGCTAPLIMSQYLPHCVQF